MGGIDSDPSVRESQKTFVLDGSHISASAIENGNGGEVVVWSDITDPESLTFAQGRLEAKGGALSGDGGRIETSGSGLEVNGIEVDTSAANGRFGLWLLDPTDITISTSGPNQITVPGALFDVSGANNTSSNSATISPATIDSALSAGNVEINAQNGAGTGDGQIIIDEAINDAYATSLTLTAGSGGTGDITINSQINRTSAEGDVVLVGGGDAVVDANVTTGGLFSATMGGEFNANVGSITADEGDIVAGGDINLGAGHSFSQGLTLDSGQKISIFSSPINITAGDASIRADGDLGLRTILAASGSASINLGTSSDSSGFGGNSNGELNVGGDITLVQTGSNAVFSGDFQGLTSATNFLFSGGGSLVLSNSGSSITGNVSISGAGTSLEIIPQSVLNSVPVDISLGATLIYNGLGPSTDIFQIGPLSGAGQLSIGNPEDTVQVFVSNGSSTFSGEISGDGSLRKSGNGTLVLSGTNTFTGDLVIDSGATLTSSGTLSNLVDVINSGVYDVASSQTINSLRGPGSIQLNNAVDLTVGDDVDETVSGAINGNGDLIKQGSSILTLDGDLSGFGGNLSINSGAVAIPVGASATDTIGGAINGSGNLIKQGSGELVLFGDLTGLTGNIDIDDGALSIDVAINNTANNAFTGGLSGTGDLIKMGAGQLTLSGDGSGFDGNAYVEAGKLVLTNADALGSANFVDVLDGAALSLMSSESLPAAFEFSNYLLLGSPASPSAGAELNISGQVQISEPIEINGNASIGLETDGSVLLLDDGDPAFGSKMITGYPYGNCTASCLHLTISGPTHQPLLRPSVGQALVQR